jgi:hypothetical protein
LIKGIYSNNPNKPVDLENTTSMRERIENAWDLMDQHDREDVDLEIKKAQDKIEKKES